MLRDLAKALDDTDKLLARDVRAYVRRLRDDGWTREAVRKHTSWLMGRHYGRAERQAIQMVEDSALYAEDYVRRIEELSPMHFRPLPPSEIRWMSSQALGNVDAAKSLVYGRSAGATAPYEGKLRLGKRLHALSESRTRKVSSYVIRAIREAQDVGYASRELVELGGIGRGKAGRLPKVIKELQESARKLNRWTDGGLDKEIKQLERYIKKINEGGTVGKAYREMIDSLVVQRRMGKGVPGKAVEKAVGRWVHYKERYYAERIIETETNTAFRASQIDRTKGNRALVGYIWRLSRSAGRDFGCQCETLDGETLRVKQAEQLVGGVHPFCSCYLEEVWDTERLFAN